MKISLNWLKDYINPSISVEQLAHKLTMAGLEVEAIHDVNGDKVLEIEVTPNRADCLNMIGVARELSAILNKKKKEPKLSTIKYPQAKCDISILDKAGCRRYIGTRIDGVRATSTPGWIKERLASVGVRSISNIVDITNFVLLETGQPLHAFDHDKLEGGKIIVRWARKGEKIVTIDEMEHQLDESVLVIADAKKPVAIAGIMGGKATEVSASTKNILLESAYFDPVLIRRTSRKLGLSSDSSYRFERGVDAQKLKSAAHRALLLIMEHAGGKIINHADISSKNNFGKRAGIHVSVERINNYLGANIKKAKIQTILKNLDFRVSGGNVLKIVPPSHRPDINFDVDIIEEIARIEGYEKLPTSLPMLRFTRIVSEPKRTHRNQIRNSLTAQGFNEIITYSLINQEVLDKAKLGHLYSSLITNPISADQERMRPSLLPGMLSTVSFNLNRGQKDLKFFEIGKIYIKEDEMDTLSLAVTGKTHQDWRLRERLPADFYDIKGTIEQTIRTIIGDLDISFTATQETFLESGGAALIQLRGETIGQIGKIDESVLHNFDIKDSEVYFAQIGLGKIYQNIKPTSSYDPISVYPPIIRDISLSFDRRIGYNKLVDCIQGAGSKILVDIQLKEDYTDIVREKIERGHRGILISLVYQSHERTLQEGEVNIDHQKILGRIVENLNALIR